eukprot:757153-Hanusia_phi.AAC.8
MRTVSNGFPLLLLGILGCHARSSSQTTRGNGRSSKSIAVSSNSSNLSYTKHFCLPTAGALLGSKNLHAQTFSPPGPVTQHFGISRSGCSSLGANEPLGPRIPCSTPAPDLGPRSSSAGIYTEIASPRSSRYPLGLVTLL